MKNKPPIQQWRLDEINLYNHGLLSNVSGLNLHARDFVTTTDSIIVKEQMTNTSNMTGFRAEAKLAHLLP